MSTVVAPRETDLPRDVAIPTPEPSDPSPRPRARRRVRDFLFWVHLTLGSALGLVILTQALTGIAIAYRRQVVPAVVDRQVATPAPGAARLSLDTLAARAAAASGGRSPGGVTLRHDAGAPVAVQFGRERTVYLDPYTGRVLPGAPRLEAFFAYAEGVHRWLALTGTRSEVGEAVTGASVLAFFGLLLSGLYLWLPARWTRRHVRAVALVTRGARGRARDWNWHHVAGLWASPLLLVTTVTGLSMAYQWPTRLLARATGSPGALTGERGPGGPPGGGREGAHSAGPRASLDTLAARALAASPPAWYVLRLGAPGGPGRGTGGPRGGPAGVSANVSTTPDLRPDLATQLTLDPATGAVRPRPDDAGRDLAGRARGWMHPVHSGEGFGVLGETAAAAGALAAAVLVWTGLSLALRRLRRRLARGAASGAAVA